MFGVFIVEILNTTKQCIKCNKNKPLEEFKLRSNGKYRNTCEICRKKEYNEYYANNREKISEKRRIKNSKDPEPNRKRVKKWKVANPDKLRENRTRENERNKTPERRAILAKKASRWRTNNPDKVKETRKKQRKRLEVKIADNLRGRLRVALKNNQKKGSAVKDLGCSIEELKVYLESKFYPRLKTGEEMTWENYDFYGWHLDHVLPLSSFNLTDREQFKKACHYTNLQPLWAEENFAKGKKIIK